MVIQLVKPSLEFLPSYRAALEKGWSPDNIRGADAAQDEIDAIARDPHGFLDRLEDLSAQAGPVKMPDGSTRPRLPGFRRWIWDGECCGSIGFRWQPGTSALPEYVLGHVGYAVVPWKRGRGYASKALMQLLPEARGLGLDYIEVTTDADNIASQRVVTNCGGQFVERFCKPDIFGGAEGLRYRINLVA